jgi:hypothetical protein
MKLEKMTFNDLVDWAAAEILKGLIAGEFRSVVFKVLVAAGQWRGIHDEH